VADFAAAVALPDAVYRQQARAQGEHLFAL
jgi:hypothetical protein